MDFITLLLIIGGFVALVAGGEFLVRGASRLAVAFGVSPLIIGLTVVSFGTSAPELAVSLQAGLQGNGAIALANVAGSNLFNTLFILGLCAVLAPLLVQSQLIKIDVPVMVVCSFVVTALAWDGRITRIEGIALFIAAIVYTAALAWLSRRESKSVQEEFEREFGAGATPEGRTAKAIASNLFFLALGMVFLVLGSDWLVSGSVTLARYLGVSDVIIGLTIIAVGTSLPEVVTSVVATLKGERDIAVGNVVGSNIYNVLLIVGLAGAITPGGLEAEASLAHIDLPMMSIVAAVSLPVFITGKRISRGEGAFFFAAYVAYMAYRIMQQ